MIDKDGERQKVETRNLTLGGIKVPLTLRGAGPLIVFDYPIGSVAWGSPRTLAEQFTTAIPEWQESDVTGTGPTSYDWLPDLFEELGTDQYVLATWSMGAPSAIKHAAAGAPGLRALILVEPAGLGSKIPKSIPLKYLHFVPSLISTLITKKPNRGYVKLLWNLWIDSPRVDKNKLTDALLAVWSRPSSFDSRNEGIQDVMKKPLFDELKQILVPTLLLAGRTSKVLGPTLAANAQRLLKKGESVIFEQSNHGPQLEEPERFEAITSEFLGRTLAER